jgi:predicted nucleotidyltransferase
MRNDTEGDTMTQPRELAEAFTADLRTALGPRLQATSLFGSAARGEWIEGVSDINVMVLLDTLDADVLTRAAPTVRAALEQGITPLVMELAEWRRAADVFSIELADMKDSSVTLLGEDPAAGAVVEPSILRLQAERELRAKLLHLHAGMIVAADDGERLGQLLLRALPSFTTYMRAALRLAQASVPPRCGDVIRAACSLAGAEPQPFLTVLDARRSGAELSVTLREPLPDEFNTAATRLANFIDAFGR